MTQEDLAERLYTKPCTVSNYENDKLEPGASKIVLLSEVLGVKPGYFFGDEPMNYYVKSGNLFGSDIETDIKTMGKALRSIESAKVRRVAIMNVMNMREL